jgi:hypothetical protein
VITWVRVTVGHCQRNATKVTSDLLQEYKDVCTNIGDEVTVAMLQAGLQNTTDSTVYRANKNEIT